MFVLPENKIGKELGQNAGGIGSTLERLAQRKIQNMEYEHNRKLQLKEMFENQQIKQQQKQGFVQRLVQNGYDPKFANIASEFMDNPKLLERIEMPGDYERDQAQNAQIEGSINQPGTEGLNAGTLTKLTSPTQGTQPVIGQPNQTGMPQGQVPSAGATNVMPMPEKRLLGARPKNALTPQMRQAAAIANAKMSQQERFHKEAAIEKSYEKATPEISSAFEKIQAIEDSLQELNNIKELNKTGQLFQGPERALLEKFKLEDVLTNVPTQIAQKSMNRLVIDVARDFKAGGRLTNDMFKVIEKGLPNLLNRPEALEANASLAEAKLKLGKARAEEQIKVEREYEEKGQKLPTAWKDVAEKRLAPTAKKLAQETKNIIDKLVRSATGKVIPEDIYPAAEAGPEDALELYGKLYGVKNGHWEEVKSKGK